MKTTGFRPLSHHTPQVQKIFWHMNCHSKQKISAAQMQHMPNKGMYLLSMHPRSLPVCRMFRLSSCLYQKQSFHTRPTQKGVPMLINIFQTKQKLV